MPDSTKEPNNDGHQESVDLSDLKSFSFGTQWTEASKSSSSSAGPRSGGRGGPRGGDRPDRRKGGGGPRKDRRPPRPPRTAEGGAAPAPQGGEERRHDGGRRGFNRGQGNKPVFRPYESPVFDICFYPEDNCFTAIIKAMRANHMTYELFHVAKLFMEKPDRFLASITRKAEEGQKPEKVFICAVDNMPFASEDEAIVHAINHHTEQFFETEEVEVEAPSGNFPFVNRCPFTKELLGPPNYHKYEETLRHHHRTRLPNMAFEKLQTAVETVREEEVVAAWLESQKKSIRYKAKEAVEGEAEPRTFESLEGAIGHIRTMLRSKVVKQVNYARVSGAVLENFKDTEAYKATDGARQRQLRFPLDTANAIRGRMRREKFSIYKKGSKGVTYVCATKRNFRTPGQVMSPELDRLIAYLESNQLVKAKELGEKYEAWLKEAHPDVAYDEKKLARDLHWLIADGYVSHFEDDTLFAQPVLETGHAGEKESKEKSGTKETAPVVAPTPASVEEKAEEAPVEAAPEAEAPAEESKQVTETPVEVAAEAETPVEIPTEAAPAADVEPSAVEETPEVAAAPVAEAPAEPETQVAEASEEASDEAEPKVSE